MPSTTDLRTPYAAALDAVVTGLESVEQQIRAAEARRLELLAGAMDIAAVESQRSVSSAPNDRKSELAYRAIRAEVAAALHQSEYLTERQISLAYSLTYAYPATFEAFRDGLISERHATTIVDEGIVIGGADSADQVIRRAEYETRILGIAAEETAGRLRPIARSIAEEYAEISLDERHAEARRRRRVFVIDSDDGMADLIAHLPAAEAYAIHGRLTAASRRLQNEERALAAASNTTAGAVSHPRSRDEIRADLFAELLLADGLGTEGIGADGIGADGPPFGVSARLQIIVPVRHIPELAGGRASRPGESSGDGATWPSVRPPPPHLEGYGPIETGTARDIAARATVWEQVSVDARGTVLSVDRYRPSEQIRRMLVARDQHCRFPGCRVPALRCDLDHTIDAQFGGPTSTENLSFLCRGHHTLKHHTKWRVTQHPGGVLDWTSPSGRIHRDRPSGAVRFVPVDTGTGTDTDTDTGSSPFIE